MADINVEQVGISLLTVLAILGIMIAVVAVFFEQGGGTFVARQSASLVHPASLTASSTAAAEEARSAAAETTRGEIARRLDIPADDIRIVSVEERQWPDICLGRPRTYEEDCPREVTPGYRITLEVSGTRIVYRADLSGREVRQD